MLSAPVNKGIESQNIVSVRESTCGLPTELNGQSSADASESPQAAEFGPAAYNFVTRGIAWNFSRFT